MLKKLLKHIQKYIFYDIFVLLILIIGIKIFFQLIHDINYNKMLENDYSNNDSTIKEIYNINPSIFNFNEEGIAIVTMTDLIEKATNGVDIVNINIPQTKNLDECVGYLIIEKENFKIDYTHICDMVDY